MQSEAFPAYRGKMEYVCVSCGARFPADRLLYSCPNCNGVFLLEDTNFPELKKLKTGSEWRETFDRRRAGRLSALSGIFRFYELAAPVVEEQDILYLGEAGTPIIPFSGSLRDKIGVNGAFKNEGQNPSASFKDRGMACAFSFIRSLCRTHKWNEVLAICASTGDTSAAAALYASYAGDPIKSVVILPRGKVTPQQLSQPLASGATVIEIPGVFDDCMRVVENLASNYNVALLNSKNPWRLPGQETYAYEVAQWCNWDVEDLCLFVPIGNAGNITAIMSGFLKLLDLGIITSLPRIFGVQSAHADPVFRYYDESEEAKRVWKPVEVRPSVAQAAMIGNPVSFPRVKLLAERYIARAGSDSFHVIRVKEQEIMDAMIEANRNGHIACTQGGECLAGLKIARAEGLVSQSDRAILDSTAHALKFMDFQNRYFNDSFGPEYEVKARPGLVNRPEELLPEDARQKMSQSGFAELAAEKIAERLNLKKADS